MTCSRDNPKILDRRGVYIYNMINESCFLQNISSVTKLKIGVWWETKRRDQKKMLRLTILYEGGANEERRAGDASTAMDVSINFRELKHYIRVD